MDNYIKRWEMQLSWWRVTQYWETVIHSTTWHVKSSGMMEWRRWEEPLNLIGRNGSTLKSAMKQWRVIPGWVRVVLLWVIPCSCSAFRTCVMKNSLKSGFHCASSIESAVHMLKLNWDMDPMFQGWKPQLPLIERLMNSLFIHLLSKLQSTGQEILVFILHTLLSMQSSLLMISNMVCYLLLSNWETQKHMRTYQESNLVTLDPRLDFPQRIIVGQHSIMLGSLETSCQWNSLR